MSPARTLIAGLAGYTVLLLLSLLLLADGRLADSQWRFGIALAPAPAAVVIVIAGVAAYRRMDELLRRIHLMALAAAFLATTITVLSWGFLEGVGLPRLGGFAAFGILNGYYLVGLVWAHTRYR